MRSSCMMLPMSRLAHRAKGSDAKGGLGEPAIGHWQRALSPERAAAQPEPHPQVLWSLAMAALGQRSSALARLSALAFAAVLAARLASRAFLGAPGNLRTQQQVTAGAMLAAAGAAAPLPAA
eukprot:CAMPEP_0198498744 /NCGR_PEP_ID=MMETSP1462-20131121/7196_1 /TAXON_ID=1333877 /ORGANISM="Brandtodinium nutriculum, Strain RCC3387" /LENGTH=121 /DNA_ID=CAMNT_0044227685 /DNA_START=314 /DNA_END=676 /DNA_ORIENTATION=+